MPNHVTRLYATNARIKQLWAETRISDPNSDLYLELGQQAGDDLIQARSATLEEVLYKLAELQEWISEDGTASEKAMIASIIADIEAFIEALQEAPGGTPAPEPDLAPAPVPQGPAPKAGGAAAPVQTAQPVAPKIRVDRRSRPVHVDGKVYPSIIAAAQALGRSYESVRSETVRGRL